MGTHFALRFPPWPLACLALVAAVGCSSGNPAEIKGRVTHNGQPVTGGELTFAPVGGGDAATVARPATATIQADGTFVAVTDGTKDGAAVGPHQVLFSPASDWVAPEWDGKGQPPAPPKGPYDGLVPKTAEMNIKPGGNELVIELVPAPQGKSPPLAGR